MSSNVLQGDVLTVGTLLTNKQPYSESPDQPRVVKLDVSQPLRITSGSEELVVEFGADPESLAYGLQVLLNRQKPAAKVVYEAPHLVLTFPVAGDPS